MAMKYNVNFYKDNNNIEIQTEISDKTNKGTYLVKPSIFVNGMPCLPVHPLYNTNAAKYIADSVEFLESSEGATTTLNTYEYNNIYSPFETADNRIMDLPFKKWYAKDIIKAAGLSSMEDLIYSEND